MGLNSHHIIDFAELDKFDEDLIGKKAYLLSELKYLGISIPDGFVILSSFFKEFLQHSGITKDLKKTQEMKHPSLSNSYAALFEPVQRKIMRTHIPSHLTTELYDFYRRLVGTFKEPSLNIFSSSLSDKYRLFNDSKGDSNLILKIKKLLTHFLDEPFCAVVQKNIKFGKKKIITNDPSIKDQNLLKLVKKIQNYFYFPQELEYFNNKNKIYITNMKPFTGLV